MDEQLQTLNAICPGDLYVYFYETINVTMNLAVYNVNDINN